MSALLPKADIANADFVTEATSAVASSKSPQAQTFCAGIAGISGLAQSRRRKEPLRQS